MKIELSKLDEGRAAFAHTYELNELDLADERVHLSGPVNVNGNVRRSGAGVVVNGRISAQVTVECDRCLTRLNLPVGTDFRVEYITANDYQSSNAAELTQEEMAVSIFDGETIDIDEIVREQILLFVPDRALCREDCKGICSSCGADLNESNCDCKTAVVDPRWAALNDLKDAK